MVVGSNHHGEIPDTALDSLRLRGPDSLKQTTSNFFAAAFARLSIIDPLVDRQPIEIAKGKFLVCNGEIYNYRELASRYLEDLDNTQVSSDVAVLGELIKRISSMSFLQEIVGMFSFVVINEKGRSVTAVRDFVGEKPLYYSLSERGIILSSSLKAIAIQLGKVTVDPFELEYWLSHGLFSPGKTLYKEIQEVPVGSKLVWSEDEIKIETFWKWPVRVRNLTAISTHVNNIKSELLKNMELVTQSDVEYAFALSNGLDSRLILNLLKEKGMLSNVTMVNILMQKDSFIEEIDECDELFDSHNKPKIIKVVFDEHLISKTLPVFLDKLDSPCSDPAILVINYLSRVIPSKYKVIITGDGGDELFRGYEIFKYFKYIMFLYPVLKVLLSKPLRTLLINQLMKLPDHEYLSWRQKGLRFLISLEADRNQFAVNAISPNFLWRHLETAKAIKPKFSVRTEQELEEYMREVNLPQLFLQKVDRGSMCEGVEFRSYFLLRNVIEGARTLPNKINRRSLYYSLTNDAFFKTRRRKHGLGVPMTSIMKDITLPAEILSNVGISPKTIQYVFDRRSLNPGFANLNWTLLTLGYHIQSLKNANVEFRLNEKIHE